MTQKFQRIKTLLSVSLLALGVLATGAHATVDEDAAKALAKKNDCFKCHAIDKEKKGPSYKKIAAKYKGNAKAEAMLVDKVKKGGTGVWGQIPMPPNAAVKDEDIKTLVKWILATK